MITIRVYGILRDSKNRVLVSDEFIRGSYYTKFPGGGLELGEGTRDCLKREFKEETNLDVSIGEHIYTTDFHQISAFNNAQQILSIYYFVHAAEPINLDTKTTLFDFSPQQVADPQGTAEVFRWVEWNDLTEETVSLPIDKITVKLLKEKERFKIF
ncbi:NUDIX hydrolase [Segetibacter koreensis]|uniref:NUDIX hydrolase n=1 Tax=Segetibacter koreensis TaxID=398037 RepID=UPI000365D84A|nr:NUDIX domain-containing protein [Segetibacter koreensis]